MHFEDWHEEAVTRPPAFPEPLEAATLKRLSASARAELAISVTDALLGQPVRSPKHELLMEDIDRAVSRSLAEPRGLRTYTGVLGPSGAGKSTLLTAWARHRYRQWIGPDFGPDVPRWTQAPGIEPVHAPVVWLTLNQNSRASSLYVGLLSALGLGLSGRVDELIVRAEKALRNHRVRLLILDDAHQVHQGRQLNREVLDSVQRIGTAVGQAGGTLMLIAATGPGESLFAHHQIKSRHWMHKFGPYMMRNAAERVLWEHFLTRIEERLHPYLPHNETGFLRAESELIWSLTQGFAGDTARMGIDAARVAIAANRPMTRRDLETAPLSERARTAIADAAREAKLAAKARPE